MGRKNGRRSCNASKLRQRKDENDDNESKEDDVLAQFHNSMSAPSGRIDTMTLVFAIAMTVVFCLLLLFFQKNATTTVKPTTASLSKTTSTLSSSISSSVPVISSWSVTVSAITNQPEIPYYYCTNQPGGDENGEDNDNTISLVLLHGAKFTKEDWKSSGILNLLCSQSSTQQQQQQQQHRKVSVWAFDLPVSAGWKELKALLDTMRNQQPQPQNAPRFPTRPLTALVTPSASGKTITNYITNYASTTTNTSDDKKNAPLSTYLTSWIPVASGSIRSCTNEQIQQLLPLVEQNVFSICAIYGNLDRKGKSVSLTLQQSIPTTKVVELQGSHPCYLDSPKAFVKTIVSYVNNDTTI